MDDIQYSEDNKPRTPSELHPKGQFKAALVDVIDLGNVPNPFAGKTEPGKKPPPAVIHKIRLVFETSAKRSTGKAFTISKSYKLNLYSGSNGGKQSSLYADLTSWFGEPVTVFPANSLLENKPATILVRHETGKDGTVYPKIVGIDPDDDMDVLTPSGEYVRYVAKESAA